MSKLVPQPHCEIIKAWADGYAIQHKWYTSDQGDYEWRDCACPLFTPDREYRVKPVAEEFYLNCYIAASADCFFGTKHRTLEEAREAMTGAPHQDRCYHCVEVLDEE